MTDFNAAEGESGRLGTVQLGTTQLGDGTRGPTTATASAPEPTVVAGRIGLPVSTAFASSQPINLIGGPTDTGATKQFYSESENTYRERWQEADGVPDDWSVEWESSTNDWAVASNLLEFENANGDRKRYGLSWDTPGQGIAVEIFDEFLVTEFESGTTFESNNARSIIYGGGAAGSENGYLAEINNENSEWRVINYDDGGGPFGGLLTLSSPTPQINTQYRRRFRAEPDGSTVTLKLKVWEAGTGEPASWGATATDSTHDEGWFGLGSFDAELTKWYYVGAAVGGATAPAPGVSMPTTTASASAPAPAFAGGTVSASMPATTATGSTPEPQVIEGESMALPATTATASAPEPAVGTIEQWTIDGTIVSTVVAETRTWQSLTLEFLANDTDTQNTLRSLETGAGKFDIVEESDGRFTAIGRTDVDNLFSLRPPSSRTPPRTPLDVYVDDYDEAIADQAGEQYRVTVRFVPDADREPTGTALSETRASDEWSFAFRHGTIATKKVTPPGGESDDDVVGKRLDLVLDADQTEALEESASRLAAVSVDEIPDGPNAVRDNTANDLNTVTITPPDGTTDVFASGDYVVADWETEWLSNTAYLVRLAVQQT